jgi:FecR protein
MNTPIRKPALLFCAMLWLSGAAMPASIQQSSPSDAPLANATVADFKGKVQVQLPHQASSTPTRGQVLPPESLVSSEDGSLLLRLEDGSEVLVHPHTRLILKQPSSTNWRRLHLWLGRIKVTIQKRVGGAPSFEIGTPSAVISVRGTRFTVQVDRRHVTSVDVEEGVVELKNAKGIGAPVLVKAGASSRVGEDSTPEPAHPTPGPQPQSHGADQKNDATKGGDPGFGRINQPHPGAGRRP